MMRSVSPTEGQGEFIVAKHRNGGLENIRLKFIGHLGKFDNLDDFDTPFGEFHSKMNAAANDDTFKPDSFPSPSMPLMVRKTMTMFHFNTSSHSLTTINYVRRADEPPISYCCLSLYP